MPITSMEVNGALIYILAISLLLFFLIVFFMILFLVRYRKSRNPLPSEIPPSPLLEIVWTIIPTIIALSMFVYGLTGFRFLSNAPADSITVKVHARQWTWLFEYDDGKKSPDLIVPLGKNVRCELIAVDVIHGFYIPSFNVQMDAVPGIKTEAWFNASQLGAFYILCSQYCGLKHSAMMAQLIIVPPDQFTAWRQGKNIRFGGNQWAEMSPGQRLLFERGCMSCHSLTGSAMVGPTFKGLFGSKVRVRSRGESQIVVADDDYIRQSIINPGAEVTDGFPNTMPPSKNILSEDEIGEIIKYLKELK